MLLSILFACGGDATDETEVVNATATVTDEVVEVVETTTTDNGTTTEVTTETTTTSSFAGFAAPFKSRSFLWRTNDIIFISCV